MRHNVSVSSPNSRL